jgi:hypothetical protein
MPTPLRTPLRKIVLRKIVPHNVVLALSLCAMASVAAAQAVDAAWVLQALARPAPMRTAFVEVRGSALLKAPLRLAGEYRRPDAGTLVREVRSPYRETTTLRSGEAVIARDGKTPRRFALSRVPELAGLQSSFGALLAGDRAGIERTYTVAARGSRERWTLTLVPKDKALAARVRDIVLYGQGAELRCIETRPARGELQRTLLASAAQAVTATTDGAGFERLCRNGVK